LVSFIPYTAAIAQPLNDQSDNWGNSTAKARLAVLSGSSPIATGGLTIGPVPVNPAVADSGKKRKALIIGNSAYKIRSLANPVNDARAMSSAFRQMGYDVTDGFDLDYAGMRRVISDFVVRAANAELSVVYYAGHGVQLQGHNYLVPIDAKLESARAANFELFDLDQIIATLDDPARTTIFILDACRNDPFQTQTAGTRGFEAGGGLAGYSVGGAGILIALAAAPGRVAEDGAGAHSPFTAALLKYITVPDLEILDVLRRVRHAVLEETNQKQLVYENGALVAEVYLAGRSQKPSAN
jgi:uncharacterized caspase-like protein